MSILTHSVARKPVQRTINSNEKKKKKKKRVGGGGLSRAV